MPKGGIEVAERQANSLEKFNALDDVKRARIINAALAEFTKGFKAASTDTITGEAGIAKGLLFHYFGTKAALYEYLIQYSLDTIGERYLALINTGQPDIIERLWQISLLKRDLSGQYPSIFEFLTASYMAAASDPSDGFMPRFKELQGEFLRVIYDGIDTSLFKEGLDIKRAVNIIQWTLNGYAQTIVSEGRFFADYQRDYDLYMSETRAYLDLLRRLLYR